MDPSLLPYLHEKSKGNDFFFFLGWEELWFRESFKEWKEIICWTTNLLKGKGFFNWKKDQYNSDDCDVCSEKSLHLQCGGFLLIEFQPKF